MLAPGDLTFLDLVIVYRSCVVGEHDLAAGQFFEMWVHSYFLTAEQSQCLTLESKHMHSPALASLNYILIRKGQKWTYALTHMHMLSDMYLCLGLRVLLHSLHCHYVGFQI